MPKDRTGTLWQENERWYSSWGKTVIDPVTHAKKRKQMFKVLGRVDAMSEKRARLLLRDAITADAGLTGDGSITFKAFVQSVWIPLRKNRWRPSSEKSILTLLDSFYKYFDAIGITDITPVTLQQYIDGLAKERAGSTVRLSVYYLRSIFVEAVEQDYIKKNPARSLRVPKMIIPTPHPFLSLDEIAALLEASKPFGIMTRESVLLEVAFTTGLRPSELLALKWKHIDLTPNASTLLLCQSIYDGVERDYTKTLQPGESKLKALPELTARILTQWKAESARNADEDFIFPNKLGGFLHARDYLYTVLKPLAEQAGIKNFTFQKIRRSVLTHAQNEGNLKDVQELAGHKQAMITANVYMQIIDASARSTADKVADKILGHKQAK